MMRSSAAGEHMHMCAVQAGADNMVAKRRPLTLQSCVQAMASRVLLGRSQPVHKAKRVGKAMASNLHCVPTVQVGSPFAAPKHLVHACTRSSITPFGV